MLLEHAMNLATKLSSNSKARAIVSNRTFQLSDCRMNMRNPRQGVMVEDRGLTDLAPMEDSSRMEVRAPLPA